MRYLGCSWGEFESMPKWVVDRAIERAKEEHHERESQRTLEALRHKYHGRGRGSM